MNECENTSVCFERYFLCGGQTWQILINISVQFLIPAFFLRKDFLTGIAKGHRGTHVLILCSFALSLPHNLPVLTSCENDIYINIVNSTNIMLSQVLLDSFIHPLDLLAVGFEVNFYYPCVKCSLYGFGCCCFNTASLSDKNG